MSQANLKKINMEKDKLLQAAIEALTTKPGIDTHSTDCFSTQQYSMGGQSLVYKVSLPGGKLFCLKLKRDDTTSIHLERESYFLEILSSKHLPRLVLNAACDGFIVEEWVEGLSFSLQNRQVLLRNLKIIVRDLAQISQDLTSPNPAVLHRDIKPNNLRFREGKVILLDFGSAEHEGDRKPVWPDCFPKLGSHTHVFQPFEQLTSQPTQDRKVDVFAAASVIFAIMERRPPYDNAQSGYTKAITYYKRRELELARTLKNRWSRLGTALFDALRVKLNVRSADLQDVVNTIEEHSYHGTD